LAADHVATYLNDHLAGAVAIVDLLAHVAAAHTGTDTGRFATELRADIVADQAELESLMARLQIAQSTPRKATGWIAEKVTQVKLWLDDPGGGPLRLLEAFDAVAVGIEGKRALWRALAAASAAAPRLRGPDYDRLATRAEDQQRRVETVRLAAARTALADAS
jgi:hypothetical protein